MGPSGGSVTRLDHGTKLVVGCTAIRFGSGWVAKWYPDAHEATLFFRGAHDGGGERIRQITDGDGVADVDANRSRAERRARSRVRLYASANGVDRLLTLTYGPPFCTDPAVAYDDVRRFIRRLRGHLGGRFPYVWVLELHEDGERLHVHLGLARFVPKADLAGLWPHGFIDIRRIRVPAGKGERAKTQKAAWYLSKYVGKAFNSPLAEGGSGCGRHRYEVGQGFQPVSTGVLCTTESEAWAWVHAQAGGAPPIFRWTSEDIEGWAGPPTRGVRW